MELQLHPEPAAVAVVVYAGTLLGVRSQAPLVQGLPMAVLTREQLNDGFQLRKYGCALQLQDLLNDRHPERYPEYLAGLDLFELQN